jgi:hypothetical protein
MRLASAPKHKFLKVLSKFLGKKDQIQLIFYIFLKRERMMNQPQMRKTLSSKPLRPMIRLAKQLTWKEILKKLKQ